MVITRSQFDILNFFSLLTSILFVFTTFGKDKKIFTQKSWHLEAKQILNLKEKSNLKKIIVGKVLIGFNQNQF